MKKIPFIASIGRMSVSNLLSLDYVEIGASSIFSLKDFVVLSDSKVFLLLLDSGTSSNWYNIFDFASTPSPSVTSSKKQTCINSDCHSFSAKAALASSNLIATAYGDLNYVLLQFFTTDGEIDSQYKLDIISGNTDANVHGMVQKNGALYMTLGAFHSSYSSALAIFDVATKMSTLYYANKGQTYVALSGQNDDIVLIQALQPTGIINHYFTRKEYLTVGWDYISGDQTFSFAEVADGTFLVVSDTSPISPTVTTATFVTNAPFYPSGTSSLVSFTDEIINMREDGFEATVGTSLTGVTVSLVVACLDGLTSQAYTLEQYGDGLNILDIMTGFDAATAVITLDTPATAGIYTGRVKASYPEAENGYLLTAFTINVGGGATSQTDSEDKSCFGSSKGGCAGIVIAIVIVGVAFLAAISVLIWINLLKGKPATHQPIAVNEKMPEVMQENEHQGQNIDDKP